ncbi:MAG: hypothetical protein M3014_03280 [Chloroflexota bacterium]|nr:hypothetical protein [Chloroflexota bacterium]
MPVLAFILTVLFDKRLQPGNVGARPLGQLLALVLHFGVSVVAFGHHREGVRQVPLAVADHREIFA